MSRVFVALAVLVLITSSVDAATVQYATGLDTGTPTLSAGPGVFTGGLTSFPPVFQLNGYSYTGANQTAPNQAHTIYPAGTVTFSGGTYNRALLDFDSYTIGSGRDVAGTVLVPGGAQAVLSASMYTHLLLGPYAKCVGGSNTGFACMPGGLNNGGCALSSCTATSCTGANYTNSGYCLDQRTPLLAMRDSSGKRGCALYYRETCGALGTAQHFCDDPKRLWLTLQYGDAQLSTGRCEESRTMTDTICGGPCLTSSDCLQGRPNAPSDGSDATACLSRISNGPCPGTETDSSKCRCVNECDENHPKEATCVSRALATLPFTQGSTYGITVQQVMDGTCVSGSNNNAACTVSSECPGGSCSYDNDISCSVFGGPFKGLCISGTQVGRVCTVDGDCPGSGTCRLDQLQAFPRGGGRQKVGVCGGAATAPPGGRKGFACSSDTPDCGCGYRICTGGTEPRNTSCSSNADCTSGGTCPSCTAGTCLTGPVCIGGTNAGNACGATSACPGGTCSTAKFQPDRVTYGWDDGQGTVARVFQDNYMIQTGVNPETVYRVETRPPDSTAVSVAGWSNGGGVCSTNNYTCLTNNNASNASGEPDGDNTYLSNSSSSTATWPHEWGFTDFTTGTGDTPIATSFNVAVQDSVGGAGNAAGVFLTIKNPSPAATASPGPNWNLTALETNKVCTGSTRANQPCGSNADCGGQSCNVDDGTSGANGNGINFYPAPPYTFTSVPGTSYSLTTINTMLGHIEKYDNGLTLSNQVRATFSTMDQFFRTVTPLAPNVLPGNKRIGIMGDSITADPALDAALLAELVGYGAVYKQATGAQAMGDLIAAAPSLFEGSGSGFFSTNLIGGTQIGPVDVATVFISANSLRSYFTADPRNPTVFDGVNQAGWCEDWTSGGGYGTHQGKPCPCDQTAAWNNFGSTAALSLIKNTSSFGTTTMFCASNADCELGGTDPNNLLGQGSTKTTGTCNGTTHDCTFDNTNMSITAAASTRTMRAFGCPPSASASTGCPGVCVSGHGIARLIAGKRQLESLAAASSAHTKLVWITQNPTTGYSGDGFGVAAPFYRGWYEIRAKIDAWRMALLAEQRATGGNWIDLYQVMVDRCGLSLLNKHDDNECIKQFDGVHYTPDIGLQYYADALTWCLSNTTPAGVPDQVTDGVCTAAAGGTCSSGKCASGLRKGITCTTDTDCNYCTGGAPSKLGAQCDTSYPASCGYYYCNFS